jgi:crotonobetainyl-CoA:carnitine CoA-transferase CaiB-like acyl-CoA transferase
MSSTARPSRHPTRPDGAPLDGLRVLETATGIAGPYAGRLLAMLGATVVKVEPPGGDPARHQPVDDEPVAGTSPLFVHLNAGKENVEPAAVDRRWAHVVIDDRVRAEIDPAEIDPAQLVGERSTGGPALVSVTPWGIDGPRRGTMADELIVQAQSGFLGFNRDPDGPPLRLPGWPAQYMAGALAAVGALAGLRAGTRHVDVSWLAAFLNSVELCYADALHCERPREPVGPHPPTAFPSGAIPCADGFVTPGSIRAVDWEMQFLLYGRPDLIDDPAYVVRQNRVDHIDELWDIIRPWYAERTKRDIFQNALDTPWAVGMVMTPTDALDDEHLTTRGLLQPVDTPDGPTRIIGSVWRGPGLPVAGPTVSARAADPAPEATPAAPLDLAPLDGLRLIEMTVAWAGPYVGNLLSPLGVDVIKLEAQAPFDGWRALRSYDHGMRPGQEHLVADNRWFEASGLFNALNRGKRGCVLSLATDEGRRVFLDLVAEADAIVANFSAHVLPQLGLDWPTLEAANPGLVVVRMPAFGVDGPYSGAAGYGSIVEAMGGIGHRQGYEHEGARISNIYYPDPVAGVHAAVGLLAGLHRRDRTGRGIELDLSHQEATWSLHGDALVLADREGRDVGRVGNRQPGCAVSGMYLAADGRWVAAVGEGVTGDAVARVVAAAAEVTADELVDRVDRAGGTAVVVLDPWSAPAVEPVAGLLETVDHPVTGPVRHLASPMRLDGERRPSRGPAPLFDQHTDEVLAQLAGYGPDRLAALRADEVIGGELPPPADLGLG